MSKILVIEDDAQILEDICMLLDLTGFTPIGVRHGKEGLHAVESENPDLILCDVAMAEMDGFEVLKSLRSNPDNESIPFVFLSARTSSSDVEEGLQAGATAYITKPFMADDLLDTINRLIGDSE